MYFRTPVRLSGTSGHGSVADRGLHGYPPVSLLHIPEGRGEYIRRLNAHQSIRRYTKSIPCARKRAQADALWGEREASIEDEQNETNKEGGVLPLRHSLESRIARAIGSLASRRDCWSRISLGSLGDDKTGRPL